MRVFRSQQSRDRVRSIRACCIAGGEDFQQSPEHAFPGLGKKRADENRVAELERKIGQQALEIDFLKRCLQRIEEQRMLQALTGKPLSTSRSGKK
jgi:transposase